MCARTGVSCALARWPGTLVSKRPLPVVRSPRFCRGWRGTLGIFRSDLGALSVEASLTPIRPPNGAWWPPTLDAEFVIVSRRGQHSVRPNEYFVTALTTTLEPDELLTEIRLPLLDDRWGTGFAEFSRRAGDFALAMCAAFLRFEDDRVVEARIGLGGATDRPFRVAAAEAVLTGTDGGPNIFRQAGNI